MYCGEIKKCYENEIQKKKKEIINIIHFSCLSRRIYYRDKIYIFYVDSLSYVKIISHLN